jgi:hypothetical protein
MTDIPEENRTGPMPAAEGRECGTCYACCVYLGIDELHKYAGQTCKHLSGANPAGRCSIYDKRPDACSRFRCAWMQGHFAADARPDNSGLLCVFYLLPGDIQAATITITDVEKAGSLEGGQLAQMVKMVMLTGVDEIRIVNYLNKIVVLMRDGKMYSGKLLKPDGYEEFKFWSEGKPFGSYLTADTPEEAENVPIPKGMVRNIL